ncbi:MAG TPA: YebC/PmpR family DNA-binding transcriptional regulator [Planctomycetes bacterium]|nr:YebC/PmpR family DNA-binding transcriptional regulator [Planctomycetota bacterium]|tara:strand:+ start:42 stop:773 length:732 start_codon:yes stop_codon:yes gene_type:complete
MAGHSHWANIQRTKSKQDAKRGKIFSKWAKLIMSAARSGGGDPSMNLPLRYAIERAKADNMPKDSIERAIRKGAGEDGETRLEEVQYEAFGPGGVAFMIETLTDNRNRTAPNLRNILSKKGGNLAESGAVSWMFQRKAVFAIPKEGLDEDAVMELALDAGADDVTADEEKIFGVEADPGQYLEVKEAIEKQGWEMLDASIRYIPDNTLEVDGDLGTKVLELVELIEEDEDVQEVHHNAEFAEG